MPERSYDDEKGVYSTSTSGTGFEGDANAKYWSFATSQTSDGDMNDTWSLTDTTQTAMFTDS